MDKGLIKFTMYSALAIWVLNMAPIAAEPAGEFGVIIRKLVVLLCVVGAFIAHRERE